MSDDELTREQSAAIVAEADEIADKIIEVLKYLLVGRGPELQGLVCADLTARWIAGHAPASLRDELIDNHLESVRRLVEVNLAALYPGGKHPYDDEEGAGHG